MFAQVRFIDTDEIIEVEFTWDTFVRFADDIESEDWTTVKDNESLMAFKIPSKHDLTIWLLGNEVD